MTLQNSLLTKIVTPTSKAGSRDGSRPRTREYPRTEDYPRTKEYPRTGECLRFGPLGHKPIFMYSVSLSGNWPHNSPSKSHFLSPQKKGGF